MEQATEKREQDNDEFEPKSVHSKAICEMEKNPGWLRETMKDFAENLTDKEMAVIRGNWIIGDEEYIKNLLLRAFKRCIEDQF